MAHKYDVQSLVMVCRLMILQQLQPNDMVETMILGHLCEDVELKDAALCMMDAEPGKISEVENWAALKKYPALSLEIADRIRKSIF